MKKEMLRINDLTYTYTETRKLENVSFYVLEGECAGILGLTYSGKEILTRLLEGDIEIDMRDYDIYIEGKKILELEEMNRKIYRISEENYRIDDWTVAEYIGLVDARWFNFLRDRKWLEDEVRTCFEDLDLDFDVSEKIGKLTELDKRIVDLVKAYRKNAKIIIIEDELGGISRQEIVRFGRVLRRIVAGRMAVLINSHSNMVASALSDKYIIFNKGHIVKKCKREYIQNVSQLEKFLFGKTREKVFDKKLEETSYSNEKNVVFRVCNLQLKGGNYVPFDFAEGQVTAILARNLQEKDWIFDVIAGRKSNPDIYYILNAKRHERAEFTKFIEEKVVSIKSLGSLEEVFPFMTVGENLLLPSLRKISSAEYIRMSRRMRQVITSEVKVDKEKQKMQMGELGINTIIRITLERWYVYNPKVLVMFEPFARCDMKGITIVREYIQKFAKRGTVVVIVNTREENLEDITDRIINID